MFGGGGIYQVKGWVWVRRKRGFCAEADGGRAHHLGLRGGRPARLEGKRGKEAGEAGREATKCPLGQVNALILIPRGHLVV